MLESNESIGQRSERNREEEVSFSDFLELHGKTALVVDDSPDNRLLMVRILSWLGMNVEFAEDGQEGIEKAREMHPDMILMDLMMPGVDGFQATEQIRASGFHGPIIALTAWVDPEIRKRCLKRGFDDYQAKPVNRVRLIHSISQLISTADGGSGSMH